MKFRHIIAFFLICSGLISEVNAQIDPLYWVAFTDKKNNEYSIENPSDFLSERSLKRRYDRGIAVNTTDLPVSSYYTDSLVSMGLDLRYTSKWLNGAVVETDDTAIINSLDNISFIDTTEFIRKKNPFVLQNKDIAEDYYDYGKTTNQIKMLNGEALHNKGYRGSGILIAVLDAGFFNMPELSVFDHIYQENRIIAVKDFADMDDDLYAHHSHGKNVMSILAGYEENKYTGAAPEADYILVRTEDTGSEQKNEEYNWVAGAEYADSLGVDVINVSLGYKLFDLERWSYSYEDTDGKTAPISIAAGMAADKGIAVVASAGNDGGETDPYIAPPADANSVFTVGSVDSLGGYSHFSSVGYTYDGRIKPTIVARGELTFYQNNSGDFVRGNGTSYSAPLISGMLACLWQAHPSASISDLMFALINSADNSNNPTDTLGYGIPDFGKASEILANRDFASDPDNYLNMYPNPVKNTLNLQFYSSCEQEIHIKIYSSDGKLYLDKKYSLSKSNSYQINIDEVASLPKGLFIIQIVSDEIVCNNKFIKN